jgi:acetyl esterase/lipase
VITVVLIASSTLFALRPVRRPRPISTFSYFGGQLVSEAPFLTLFLLAASTVLALVQGDIDAAPGWIAVGIAVLTVPGLVLVVRRALPAGESVERALDEGLEPDRGSRRGASGAPTTPGGLRRWARIVLGPWPFDPRVKRTANRRYGPAGRKNLLDVYRPRGRAPSGPTLVYFHGGRFRIGKKNREARPLLHRLARRGWVCISANYRLAPAARFPDYHVDMKRVIAWVREHGGDLGADPSAVYVAGSSAGAHIAALTALSANDPRFQPGFEKVDTTVRGAICLYGYYGDLNDDPLPSRPAAYAGPGAPPFFIAHGELDPLVAAAKARSFAAELRAAGVDPVVYAELAGAHHTFDLFHSIRFEALIDGIEVFLVGTAAR